MCVWVCLRLLLFVAPGSTVAEFCEEAGVDVALLEPGAAESELADFFALLEDPVYNYDDKTI